MSPAAGVRRRRRSVARCRRRRRFRPARPPIGSIARRRRRTRSRRAEGPDERHAGPRGPSGGAHRRRGAGRLPASDRAGGRPVGVRFVGTPERLAEELADCTRAHAATDSTSCRRDCAARSAGVRRRHDPVAPATRPCGSSRRQDAARSTRLDPPAQPLRTPREDQRWRRTSTSASSSFQAAISRGWRHPSGPARDITSMSYYQDVAQLAERGSSICSSSATLGGAREGRTAQRRGAAQQLGLGRHLLGGGVGDGAHRPGRDCRPLQRSVPRRRALFHPRPLEQWPRRLEHRDDRQ